jgi:hypothetical protein
MCTVILICVLKDLRDICGLGYETVELQHHTNEADAY